MVVPPDYYCVHIHASSYRRNYLDLDPTYRDAYGLRLPRMTFDWNNNELRMMNYLNERCTEIARAFDGSGLGARTRARISVSRGIREQTTLEAPGWLSDPSTSVVSKYLQSWDVSNLFVVGGSAFPASGPTETIGMLARWAADAIKENYVCSPGSLV
jgi:gluconate 2-dehydrogenase alpha chain